MIRLTVLTVVSTLIQIGFTGFHFNTLFCIIGRTLFCFKLRGVKVALKPMWILEGTALIWSIFFPFLFRWGIDWKHFVIQFICSAVVALAEFYDNMFMVYDEVYEDTDTDDEEDYY